MLSEVLGSETKARVLTALLERPRASLHLRELIRRCGSGSSGVQRAVAQLERAGIVTTRRDDAGRRAITVVDEHPLVAPLEALVRAAGAAQAASPVGSAPASGGVSARPGPAAHAAARVHPRLRRRLPRIVAACRRAGAERAVLFGSAADAGAADEPRDLDVVVRLGGPVEGRAARSFTLRIELEQAAGLPVDLVEEEALTNPYLSDELARTGVVILEAT